MPFSEQRISRQCRMSKGEKKKEVWPQKNSVSCSCGSSTKKNKIKNRKAEKRLMVKRYIRGCSIVMITLADNVHQGGGG